MAAIPLPDGFLSGGGPLERHADTSGKIGIALILGLVLLHRIYLLLTTDFPINDGALFLLFIERIADGFPALPPQIDFNGLGLPFAYPPLSFWLAAGLTKLGYDPLELVRVAPILMNIGFVAVVAALLLRLNYSKILVALALFFFCTNFRSFEWLLMGGGIARGLGALLMMAALLPLTSPRPGRVGGVGAAKLIVSGACVGGAILSHPQWGILAAVAVVALLAVKARGRADFLIGTLVMGAVASALVLPWFLWVLRNHGFEPFLAALGSSERDLLATTWTNLAKAAIINPFILIGAVVLLVRRDYFWLILLVLSIVITPRLAPTVWALPIAVFAAQGALTATQLLSSLLGRPKLAAALVGAAVFVIVGARIERDVRLSGDLYQPLKPELRAAMSWVLQNRRDGSFAIINEAPWHYDSSAEWFPLLSHARSVTTVQGREWLANDEYERWVRLSERLKESATCSQVLDRLRPFGQIDHVWAETHQSCFKAAGMKAIFANPAVTIYQLDR